MRRLALFMLLITGIASAQTTSVSGTVTDSDGISWANGSITFQLVNPNPQINPTCNGTLMTQSQISFVSFLDASGTLAQSVCSTASIVPALTQWRMTICSNTSAPCQTMLNQKIDGGSLNLTTIIAAQIQAIRLPASPTTRAYADVEITPTPQTGGSYYNVISNTTRTWNGSTWVAGGGGGSTAAGGVWQREGTILSPMQGEEYNASEPTLIYEGSPQIAAFSGAPAVFKLWWNCGYATTGLCYAESIDAENWVRWTSSAGQVIARSNPGPSHGYVFHYNGTYYYFTAAGGAASATHIDSYTSSNGITWTLSHANVLTLGAGGSWDGNQFGNMFVIPSAGQWLMMYEAFGAAGSNGVFWMGTATSNDQGVTWTKNPSNPTLKGPSNGESGGPEIHLIGSTYYVWYTCNSTNQLTPTDMCRAHSTDFNAWTVDGVVMTRATSDEGMSNSNGQIADPSMQQVNGTIYMIYDGVLAQNGTTPDAFHLKLATAPYTFAQLVTTSEGNATSMHAAGSFENLNLYPCVYYDYNSSNIRVPCGTTGSFTIGGLGLLGNTPSIGHNYNIYFDGIQNTIISAGAGAVSYLDTSGGVYHFYLGPVVGAGANANMSEIWNSTSAAHTFKVPVTLSYTNPALAATDTGTAHTLQYGVSGGIGYMSAPSGAPGFFGFAGFGSAPIIVQQSNGTIGWASSTSIFGGVNDTAFSRYGVNAIAVGNGTANDASGNFKAGRYNTGGNCSNSASPAVCVGSAAGNVVVAASATSIVVNTTAVSANSQIFVTFDSSLGSKLSVTCNTTYTDSYITARTAGTSFTINVAVAPTTNPACFSYFILN